jgi:hypothetical protein
LSSSDKFQGVDCSVEDNFASIGTRWLWLTHSRNTSEQLSHCGLKPKSQAIRISTLPLVLAGNMIALFILFSIGIASGFYLTVAGLIIVILSASIIYALILSADSISMGDLFIRLCLAIVVIQLGYFFAVLLRLRSKKRS